MQSSSAFRTSIGQRVSAVVATTNNALTDKEL
jgi:hypothetical protein